MVMTFFYYVDVTKLANGHQYIFKEIFIERNLWIIYISSKRKCFKNIHYISGGVYIPAVQQY